MSRNSDKIDTDSYSYSDSSNYFLTRENIMAMDEVAEEISSYIKMNGWPKNSNKEQQQDEGGGSGSIDEYRMHKALQQHHNLFDANRDVRLHINID